MHYVSTYSTYSPYSTECNTVYSDNQVGKKSAPKEKTKRNDYMKQYRAEKPSEMKRRNAEHNKKCRTKNMSEVYNTKHAEYMRPTNVKKRNKARIIRSCWFNKEAEPEK